MEKKNTTWLAGFLLLLHLCLSLHAVTLLSPTWDEIAYPYSGVVQLTTGSLRGSPQNPFLARLMYGLPFLFTDVEADHLGDPLLEGFSFTYGQKTSPKKIILLGRLLPVIFSVLLALLLYRWSRQVWGEMGGLLTLAAYLVTPILISRASLALMEMPMFFFLTLSLWWYEKRKFMSAAMMGLALLCKLTALPAFAALFCLMLVRKQIKVGFIWAVLVVGVMAVGYLLWDGGLAALHSSLTAMFLFNKTMPYYFFGSYRNNAPGVLSLAALFLKAPLFTCGLGLWGFFLWWNQKNKRDAMMPFLFVAGAYLLFGVVSSAPVSTIQLSPIYLAVVFSCGALGAVLSKGVRQKKVLIVGLLVISAVDVYRIYPNHLAYFNLIAGGPERGHFWLGDSDQDWGQSLPALGLFLKKNSEAVIYLSYSGAGKPEAHGVNYVDFFSPSLASRAHIDAPMPTVSAKGPAYFILGTKVAQSYGGAFAWVLQNRKPKKLIGQTFFVYDISQDAEFFNWMGEFYGATNRGEKAAWCAAKAELLSSTDTALRK